MVLKNELRKNEYKLLIFDIDGTIVYYDTLKELTEEAFKSFGLPTDKKFIDTEVSAVIQILNDATNEKCFNFESLCEYWKNYMPFLNNYNVSPIELGRKLIDLEIKYSKVYPNVREVTEQLSASFDLVCSTNWFRYAQLRKLDYAEIKSFISNLYTCEELYAKPNPNHFLELLDNERINSEEAIMIGDSKSDILSTKANIQSVLIDYNKNKSSIYNDATAVVTEFSDILKLVRK